MSRGGRWQHRRDEAIVGRETVSEAFAQTTGATSVRQNRVYASQPPDVVKAVD
ncbi:hypothetical protein [Bradyrhizobium sp. DASA03007]|uniref:hypothetical protein n=1 Tax=unclassified Bradyrhizobium TaxID=2631580 RepID=UPI003F6F0313